MKKRKNLQKITKKQNCWEFMKCGRESNGKNFSKIGACPAPLMKKADGANSGRNAGRICWSVAGTLCDGHVVGTFAKKIPTCEDCKFFKKVKIEEKENFKMFIPSKIKAEFGNLSPNQIILAISSAENVLKNNLGILRTVLQQGNVIYVTANHPHKILVDILKSNKINTENIYFVDCVTKTIEGSAKDTKKAVFVESPRSLTNTSIAILKFIDKLKGNVFCIIDDLSTLSISNPLKTISEFAYSIISKLRLAGATGIIIGVEDEINSELLDRLIQFTDKTVKI